MKAGMILLDPVPGTVVKTSNRKILA